MDTIADGKSRARLKEFLKKSIINECGGSILDIAEVAVSNKDAFKSFRAKVLRILNDGLRKVDFELDSHYNVKYDSNMESVFVIKKEGDK